MRPAELARLYLTALAIVGGVLSAAVLSWVGLVWLVLVLGALE